MFFLNMLAKIAPHYPENHHRRPYITAYFVCLVLGLLIVGNIADLLIYPYPEKIQPIVDQFLYLQASFLVVVVFIIALFWAQRIDTARILLLFTLAGFLYGMLYLFGNRTDLDLIIPIVMLVTPFFISGADEHIFKVIVFTFIFPSLAFILYWVNIHDPILIFQDSFYTELRAGTLLATIIIAIVFAFIQRSAEIERLATYHQRLRNEAEVKDEHHQHVQDIKGEHATAKTARSERIRDITSNFDNRITDTFNGIAGSIKKIFDSTHELSKNAGNTEKQVALISDASAEMVHNIKAVSDAGSLLSESIQTVLDQVSQSRNISENASTQANDANTKIQGLADAAQRIGEVVSLINDIANQTNLLALNATIEAARAGESGKGFAVVANEVKNLANQTARATDEISSQIQNIQSETKYAVGAIAEVTKVVTNISSLSKDIADSIQTQTNSVHEISKSAQATISGADKIETGIIAVQGAAKNTGDKANELALDTDLLKELSDHLDDNIRKFHDEIERSG